MQAPAQTPDEIAQQLDEEIDELEAQIRDIHEEGYELQAQHAEGMRDLQARQAEARGRIAELQTTRRNIAMTGGQR